MQRIEALADEGYSREVDAAAFGLAYSKWRQASASGDAVDIEGAHLIAEEICAHGSDGLEGLLDAGLIGLGDIDVVVTVAERRVEALQRK